MDDEDVIRPVFHDSVNTKPSEKPPVTFFDRLTSVVRTLCGLAAIASLIAALWFFIGFLENDTGFWHVLSAFAMSMGMGALAFIPALWIARLARMTALQGARLSTAFLVILLAIPWSVLGGLLARLEGHWRVLGLSVMVLVAVINLWAFLMALRSRR